MTEVLLRQWKAMVAAIVLITAIVFIWRSNSLSNTLDSSKEELSFVKETVCWDLWEQLNDVKLEHAAYLDEMKESYTSRAMAQFNADYKKWEQSAVELFDSIIASGDNSISEFEKQAGKIRMRIMDCTFVK